MAYIAELQIKVDTTQLDQAKRSLDDLSKVSPKVESSTDGIANSFKSATTEADNFTAAQSRLIARAREQVETFGRGKDDVLSYRAGLLGVSGVVDPLVNQLKNLKNEQQALNASQREQDAVNKAVVKSQEQLSSAQYKLIESLKEEIALFGKSKEEILLYRAGLMGISDQVNPLVQELQRLKQAKEEEAAAGQQAATTRLSKREAEKKALADEARELEKIIALERERIRAANAEAGAAPSTERLESALERQRIVVEQVEQSNTGLARSSREVAQAARIEAEAVGNLLSEIDPTAKALARLESQQMALQRAFKRGFIDKEQFDQYNGLIINSQNRIDDLGKTTGKTAKEINFALRGLPAQFTDIFVSLQGGQAPLTVFLQQGGQIKDMFGGVGPALRAMGGYVLSLISPFTLAAAAIGAFTVAAFLGSRESERFRVSLISTGNAAGTTVSQLNDMAGSISNTIGTTRSAAAALNLLANSSKITSTSFQTIATAALKWEKATGTSIEDTIGHFESLRGDPVKAIEELDEKYNFLTGATYQQIAALQEQGRTAEATAIAERELARTLNERSDEIVEDLGFAEAAWNAVTGAASAAWDAMLDVGRRGSLNEQLADAFSLLEDTGVRSGSYAPLVKRIDELQALIAEDGEKALNASTARLIKNNSVNGQKYINALVKDGETRAEKVKRANEKLDKSIADARLDGIELSEETIAKARKGIEDKYKESRSGRRAETIREDAATRLLSTLRQQEASLTQQAESSSRIGREASTLAKLEQQFIDIELKQKTEVLTKDQESLLANKEAILSQQRKNVDIEKELKAKQELAKLDTIRASIEAQQATDRQKYQDALIGTGVSDKEAERLRERNRLTQEYQRQIEAIAAQRREGTLTDEGFNDAQAQYQESLRQREAMLAEHYAKLDELQGNWSVGAKKAWENYLAEGSNVAGLTQTFFANSFKGMEDALVGFVTTGKLSFKDLTISILKDLAAMATKIAANQILMSIIGSFGGGVGTPGSASFVGPLQADGGGWDKGVQFFAKGGAFTNSVVNKPTAFGTGSGIGVMGEAGPEAILPLTRTSNGQLGVVAAGGGSSTVVAPVSVTVNTGDNSNSSGATDTESSGRAVQMAVKTECEKAISNGLKPGGQIWRALNGR